MVTVRAKQVSQIQFSTILNVSFTFKYTSISVQGQKNQLA